MKRIICSSLLALAASSAAAVESISLSNAVHVVDIPAGKAFKFISCLSDGSEAIGINIGGHTHKITSSRYNNAYNYNSYGYNGDTTIIQTGHVVSGPCIVTLFAQEQEYQGYDYSNVSNAVNVIDMKTSGMALFTYEVSSPGSQFQPSTGVVIPEDGTGTVTVIMESSADLVNWTQALPGTYGRTEPRRFFRLRIVNN